MPRLTVSWASLCDSEIRVDGAFCKRQLRIFRYPASNCPSSSLTQMVAAPCVDDVLLSQTVIDNNVAIFSNHSFIIVVSQKVD